MNRTQVKILLFLQSKARKGEKISSLQDLSSELNINYYTLSDNLIKLNKLGKINYKGGKILNVYTETHKGNMEYRKIEQHKNKYSMKELEDKFDECVKEIICDYIKSIDASSFNNVNLNNVISNITNITDTLKEKLLK